MLLSEFLPLNVRIILSDTFSDRSPSYIVLAWNHYRRTNHNRRLMMGLTSTSCISDTFFPITFSLFYLIWCHLTNYISITNLTIMGLNLGPLLFWLYNFPLENPFVVLVYLLVVSVAYDFAPFFWLESNFLLTLVCWSCSYHEELSTKVVNS